MREKKYFNTSLIDLFLNCGFETDVCENVNGVAQIQENFVSTRNPNPCGSNLPEKEGKTKAQICIKLIL